MTTRIHTELRKLALAYYRGWITRDRYLQIRQDYLQYISDGKVPAAIDPKLIAPPRKKSSTVSSTRAKPKKTKWLLVLMALIVLLALAAVFYLATDTTSQDVTNRTTATDTQLPAKSLPEQTAPATDEQRFTEFLSANFLNKRTWEIDALNSIKLKWLGLSQEQQKTVSSSRVFQDFSGALVERIVDERDLNNVVPSDYELALMTVAKNMEMMNLIPER
jgi:hypothetical protein